MVPRHRVSGMLFVKLEWEMMPSHKDKFDAAATYTVTMQAVIGLTYILNIAFASSSRQTSKFGTQTRGMERCTW